jgi:hypothetical protein
VSGNLCFKVFVADKLRILLTAASISSLKAATLFSTIVQCVRAKVIAKAKKNLQTCEEKMRLWYKFLLILLVFGLFLFFLGKHYVLRVGEYRLGWDVVGAIILVFLLAVGLLYFERWRRRWWQS